MVTWKRSTMATSWRTEGGDETDETPDVQVDAVKERVFRFFENLAKGSLAAVLYGSGTLVLSGVLFYFSWKLGIAALFVLAGLMPMVGSTYLLWRLMRRGRPPWLWRGRWRQGAILKLAWRQGGRLTVADVALGTGLSLGEAKAALNELARKGYAGLQVAPSGVVVYHFFSLADVHDKNRTARVLS
jgi:hypothetical protein